MKLLLILCCTLLISSANAQTWDEWFRQKQTKLNYIEQQIAALEVYGSYLKKGYDIVENGWNVVSDIKHGDFGLHNNYFTSLKQVNSSVRGYEKISSITDLQMQVLQVNDATKKFIQGNENIQTAEKAYVNNVMINLLDQCGDDLDELILLTTNDSVSMRDDERIKHIDDLYIDMQDKYAFAKYFQSSVQKVALLRAKETNNVNTSKLLYQIK